MRANLYEGQTPFLTYAATSWTRWASRSTTALWLAGPLRATPLHPGTLRAALTVLDFDRRPGPHARRHRSRAC